MVQKLKRTAFVLAAMAVAAYVAATATDATLQIVITYNP
jgi:hypothetical protein